MISGRATLASIERAILGVRSNEDQLMAALRSATEEAGRLRVRQAEGIKALAAIRLNELARANVVAWLDTRERQAVELFNRHQRAAAAMVGWRSQALAAAQAAEADYEGKAAAVEATSRQLEELTSRVEATAKRDPLWIAQQDKVKAAEAKAKAAANKAAQAEADRQAKGKPYETDRCSCICGDADTAHRPIAPARFVAISTAGWRGSSATIRRAQTFTR